MLSISIKAQVNPQVLNTAGLFLQGQNSWFDIAIGETITSSDFGANQCFTQGYLQPKIVAATNAVAFVETININVFPNPFTSIINVSTDRVDLNIVITSTTGQIVMKTTGERIIDLSAFPSGIYLLSIFNSQNEILAIHKLCKLNN